MAYGVKESEASAVAEVLVALWRRNLPVAEGDVQAKLRWFYLEGPHGPARALVLQDSAGSPIGCAGIGHRRFSLTDRAELVPAALLADLAVDRAHRSGFPAMTLTRAAREAARRIAPIHYGFPNPSAVGLFERMGYRKLGVMTRWVRILRHAAYVERVLASPILARAAGALVDAARLVELTPARVAALRYRLDHGGPVDARFDRLWDAGRRQYGAIAWRGAEFLRWRFLGAPGARLEIVALVERGGRAVRAYAAVERVETVFHIRDAFGVSLADTGLLLDLLVPDLRAAGGTALSFSFLGSPRVEALLRAHRFQPREATRAVVVDARPGNELPATESWYVTDGDEDNI